MEFPGQLLLCVPAPRRDTDGLINGGRRFGVIPILRQRFRRLQHEAEHFANIVTAFLKAVEIGVLEDRLLALEQGRAEDLAEKERERRYDA